MNYDKKKKNLTSERDVLKWQASQHNALYQWNVSECI